MFFYKVTTRSKRGDAKTSRNSFHQFLKPAHAGEHVGTQLTKPSVTSISVTRISQAAYQRARG